jgi:hypothetical protein
MTEMKDKTRETASRADDKKTPAERPHRGGNVSDGKDASVAQGGKRRGPGHWEKAEDPSGD